MVETVGREKADTNISPNNKIDTQSHVKGRSKTLAITSAKATTVDISAAAKHKITAAVESSNTTMPPPPPTAARN